jgi:glycerol-3-phosphate dehydrogenase (NAD(P)+)
MEIVAVLGAGSWGTTLAVLLAHKGVPVRLYEALPRYYEKLRADRENRTFLPGIPLPDRVEVHNSVPEALSDVMTAVLAIPSAYLPSFLRREGRHFSAVKTVVNVAKGFAPKGGRTLCEFVESELKERRGQRADLVALSGPSHAEEVSRGIPTTIVAASRRKRAAERVQALFSTDTFRVYTNTDIHGVEIAAALKNVIAVACGISDGIGFGDNTKAALLTRGLEEIKRLGVAMGAKERTFSGLSGLGDLVTTCISEHSRNRHLGKEIGGGRPAAAVLESMTMVAEGYYAAKAAHSLMRRYDVDMPISREVYRILYRGKDARRAVKDLLSRDLKPETGRR